MVKASNPLMIHSTVDNEGGTRALPAEDEADGLEAADGDMFYSSDSLFFSESEEDVRAGSGGRGGAADESGDEELDAYWIDYVMRVPCEQPRATGTDTLDLLKELEDRLGEGLISADDFNAAKTSLSKQFFGNVVDVDKVVRAIAMVDVQVYPKP